MGSTTVKNWAVAKSTAPYPAEGENIIRGLIVRGSSDVDIIKVIGGNVLSFLQGHRRILPSLFICRTQNLLRSRSRVLGWRHSTGEAFSTPMDSVTCAARASGGAAAKEPFSDLKLLGRHMTRVIRAGLDLDEIEEVHQNGIFPEIVT